VGNGSINGSVDGRSRLGGAVADSALDRNVLGMLDETIPDVARIDDLELELADHVADELHESDLREMTSDTDSGSRTEREPSSLEVVSHGPGEARAILGELGGVVSEPTFRLELESILTKVVLVNVGSPAGHRDDVSRGDEVVVELTADGRDGTTKRETEGWVQTESLQDASLEVRKVAVPVDMGDVRHFDRSLISGKLFTDLGKNPVVRKDVPDNDGQGVRCNHGTSAGYKVSFHARRRLWEIRSTQGVCERRGLTR
jgi:hypothetical protein